MKKYMWPLLLFLLHFHEICGIISNNNNEEKTDEIDVSMVFDYESEYATYYPIFNQEDLQKMQVQPNTTKDLDADICKASKSFFTPK